MGLEQAGGAQSDDATRGEDVTRVGFAPIVRVDATRREVELCATSDAVDSHGTIFDYEASKDAFTRWIGNVREMHERRAVGQRVGVRCDDETRRIFVTLRISRGAQDTWEKVCDGTLRGASIGASHVVWQRQRRRLAGEERELDVATRYDLVELSLVDNPSNPDALGISFVRDATLDLTLLDRMDGSDDGPERREDAPNAPIPPTERYEQLTLLYAPLAATSQAERLHDAARAVLAGCGCALCAGMIAVLAPTRTTRASDATPEAQEPALARALGAGLRASVERLDQMGTSLRALDASIQTGVRQLVEASGELRRRVERLEAQPLPGGPVAHVGAFAGARPVEKRHALASGVTANPGGSVAEQLRALESLAGRLADPQAQIAVAAEMIRLQREG